MSFACGGRKSFEEDLFGGKKYSYHLAIDALIEVSLCICGGNVAEG